MTTIECKPPGKQRLEFTILSNKSQPVTAFGSEELLLGIIYANVHGDIFHKIRYNPSIVPVDFKNTRILFASKTDCNLFLRIPGCLDFINQIEDHLDIRRTKIKKTNHSNMWIASCSSRWLNSPPMLSLYTLLIRVGLIHEPNMTFEETLEALSAGNIRPYQSFDRGEYIRSLPAIHKIFRMGDKRIFFRNRKTNYSKKISITKIHFDCSIYGYARQLNEAEKGRIPLIPFWCRHQR